MKKYICSVCGYIHEGESPPERCPMCKVPSNKFNELQEGPIQFVQEHIGLFHIVWQAQYVDIDSFKNYYERFSAAYTKHIKRAIKRGEIKPFKPEMLSYYMIGVYNFVVLKVLLFDQTTPTEALIQDTLRFVRFGYEKLPLETDA